MKTNQHYNYEEYMMSLDDVLDLMQDAMENHKPLSLGRFSHGELTYISPSVPLEWKMGYEPDSLYCGVTVPSTTLKDALIDALKMTDIVGFHRSEGGAWEDREAAKFALELLQNLDFRPKRICHAFVTHEMIKDNKFWECLKNRKVALVGRRAAEAIQAFKNVGVDITYTTTLEGYGEIEKVYEDLSKRDDWDIALLAAGIPATILAPRLANQASRVVIDFGHALDKFLDGESFDYPKLVRDWKKQGDKEPFVSMIMAVYNGEKFLKEGIGCALAQTYPNLEMIIVNDGSTDSTKTILDKIEDKRIKVVHLEKNQGAANALNIGISQAKGSWIAIQDADDYSYPKRIEKQVKYILDHPQLVGVGTFVECIPGSPEISEGSLKSLESMRNSFISREDIRKKIYWGCPLTHSSMMFSKEVFLELGGYNSDFRIAYDYDLWLRLLEKGDIENVPKILVQYRLHKGSLSSKDIIATINEVQIASTRAIWKLLKKEPAYQPRVIVMGPQKGCENFRDYIVPTSGLKVKAYAYEDWHKIVPHAVQKLKDGKIDAIIILEGSKQKSLFYDLKRHNLKFNRNVFVIYNYLE